MAGMSDEEFLARTEQFARHLGELGRRWDEQPFALLLRILGGVNDALSRRSQTVDVPFGPGDKELFTAEFGRELETLMGLLGPHGMPVVVQREQFPADQAERGPGGPPEGILGAARSPLARFTRSRSSGM